jgi:hypothetical protein
MTSCKQDKSSGLYLDIPVIDLDRETFRQVVVDKEEGLYLGHPTKILLEDGKTILTVYPKGHGKGAIVYKKSTDGGLTWSERIPVPASWETSLEVPTIHRVVDAEGKKRLIVFSGLYPARMAWSEDDGSAWSDLVKGNKGQYRIRFKDNKHDWDCCYPGVELLPDGTFVVTTYGHWEKDQQPYILSVRFTLNELDERLKMNI